MCFKPFRKGDKVVRTYDNLFCGMSKGDTGIVTNVRASSVNLKEYDGNHSMFALELYKGEGGKNKMNDIITKLYEKTADAVVVDKYFSGQIGEGFIKEVVLKPHADEILKEAQKRQKADDERKK